jgi:large subunit ribosomal protein L32
MAVPHVVECPRCRSPRLSHTACPVCGTYRGREAITLPNPELES